MKKLINLATVFAACFFSLAAVAQNDKVEMANVMRSNGRVYVVVAVVVLILIGLLLYLVRLEKKINRLEKENTGS
ncbi:MAG: CcmD family protein [Chitinophagaceae bacterium]